MKFWRENKQASTDILGSIMLWKFLIENKEHRKYNFAKEKGMKKRNPSTELKTAVACEKNVYFLRKYILNS